MKSIVDFIDFVLLLILLGFMLPFLFKEIKPLMDMKSYGFQVAGDKTMKQFEGDVLMNSDMAWDDSLTAADIILMTKVVNREAAKPIRYSLPDGSIITVDKDYHAYVDSYMQTARRVLDITLHYQMSYDYTADIWRLTERWN